jgi:hypothetical protein
VAAAFITVERTGRMSDFETTATTPEAMRAYLSALPPEKIHAFAERVMRSRVSTENLRRKLREPRTSSSPAEAVMGELELIEIEARLRMWWRAIGREYRDRLVPPSPSKMN